MPDSGEPLVSVLIPSYNYAGYLPRAIESVLAQTYQNLEIIIVDNASTDDSLDVARRYASDPRVTVHANDENIGLVPNFLRAWDLSTGDFITTLCADDAFLPNHISQSIHFYAANPNVDIFYTSYLALREDGSLGGRVPLLGLADARSFAGRDEYQQLLENESFVCFPTVLFRRDLVERLGFISSDFRVAADYELFIRYAKSGARFAFKDAPAVAVRFHEENHSSVKRFVVGGLQLDEYLKIWERHLEPAFLPRLVGRRAAVSGMLANKVGALRRFDPEHAEGILAREIPRIRRVQELTAQIPDRLADRAQPVRVSVIVPTIGKVEFLANALASIEAQTYQNFEIVLVGDGAPDLTGVISALSRPDRVRYVELGTRGGPAVARNAGLRMASGEIIAYLDDDDLWSADHLAALVPAFDDLRVEVAAGMADLVMESLTDGNAYVRSVVGRLGPSRDAQSPWVAHNAPSTPISALLHRRSVVDRAGWFNVSLAGFESFEFCLRLTQAGLVAVSPSPTVEVRYRVGLANQFLTSRLGDALGAMRVFNGGAEAGRTEAYIADVVSALQQLAQAGPDASATATVIRALSGMDAA